MLSGTEILTAAVFIITLVMSIIDVAFSNANKISVRRLIDSSKSKAAPSLAILLESRSEVLISIHIGIQLLLVSGAVLLFGAFEARRMPYVLGVAVTVVVMMIVILVFRHLIPRIITMRNPEIVLLRLFPIFKIAHFAFSPISRLLMAALNYFHRWEEVMEPTNEEETSEEEIQAFIDAGQ